jgi:ribosomal protein L7/L12
MTLVEITGWQIGFNKVACTQLVRAAAGFGLAEAKCVTDGVLDGEAQRIPVPSVDISKRLAHDLTEIGAIVEAVDA